MRQYFKIIIFLFVYIFIMLLKRNFLPADIVFYEGISVCFLMCIIIYICKFLMLDKIIILFLICIYFWSLGPTILDRSVSITVLGKLSESQSFSINELNNDFKEIYVYKNGAVNKRLAEQVYNGNVVKKNSKYRLTKKGIFTKKIILLMTNLFNIDDNYIKRTKPD